MSGVRRGFTWGLILLLVFCPVAGFLCRANASDPANDVEVLTSGDYMYTLADGKVTITGCNNPSVVTLVVPDQLHGHEVICIGDNAFYGCFDLTRLTIPASVIAIGKNQFGGCPELTRIDVVAENPIYASIDGVLFDKQQKMPVACPSRFPGKTYEVPKGILRIGDYAFVNCSGLTSVTLPDSLTSIGDNAFMNCDGLTSLTLPDGLMSIGDEALGAWLTSVKLPASLTSIGKRAFANCSSMTSIDVDAENPVFEAVDGLLVDKQQKMLVAYPKGVSNSTYVIPQGILSIGDNAFWHCTGLTSVTLPNGLTSIGVGAFGYCYDLTHVTLPDSLMSIGDGAFWNCPALTSVKLPASLTVIGKRAFARCNALTSINVDAENPVYETVDGVLFDKQQKMLVIYPLGLPDEPYETPQGIQHIGDDAFSYCSSLTRVVFPNGLVSIGDNAFVFCTALTNMTLPDGLITISDFAFLGCDGLTSVTIPASVTSIGERVFDLCPNLTLTVDEGSYAEQYAKANSIPYSLSTIG